MDNCFRSADLMLPASSVMNYWAVIACDQFTSDYAYWDAVSNYVSDHPSTYHLILPEAYLVTSNDERIQNIQSTMRQYLSDNVLDTHIDSFVYVERTLLDGSVRQGIVGVVDLEKYSFNKASDAMLLATEQTVLERIPPRMAVREDAALELSHVIIFCNDPEDLIMTTAKCMKCEQNQIYDFDLMQGGGHISGWLINNDNRTVMQKALDNYVSSSSNAACYLVADGNHSLATAKQCYEKAKAIKGDIVRNSPLRYAMVELENIHSSVIQFEPIHRIITNVDCNKILEDVQKICSPNGYPIDWVHGNKRGQIRIRVSENQLPLAVFQDWMDEWLSENEAQIDYIHDDDALISLAQVDNSIGFFMPRIEKNEMFSYVASGSILPRKAFSLGHAAEKRYYLEGRKIV